MRRWLARAHWLPGALVAVVTLIVFLPALQDGFVNWDDDANFLWNPHYRGLGWANLQWMFTSVHMGLYTPVTWMTLGLDYALWGMRPWGYHLTSVLLHSVNAFLLYLVSVRLLAAALGADEATGRIATAVRVGAGVAALFFSVHPLRVESVAWVTERRDVVVGLFSLLTVLAYLRACRRAEPPRLHRGWYWTAVGLFALALLSKAIVVGLPLVLLALDVYPLRRASREEPGGERLPGRNLARGRLARLTVEKMPFLALSAAVSGVTLAILAERRLLASRDTLDLVQRLAVSGYGIAFYLWKTLAPWPLSPLYTLFHPVVPSSPRYLVPAGVTLLITGSAIALSRRWAAGLVVWTSYVVLVLPVLGLFHSGAQIAADRYTYMACLSWALLLGGGVAWCWRESLAGRLSPRLAPAALGASVLLIGALIALTVPQIRVWRDSVTLWQHAAAAEPDSDIPIFYLGWALMEQGRLDDARAHFARSLERVPAHLPLLRARLETQLGIVDQRAGRLAEAADDFRKALALLPTYPVAMIRLGAVLLARGESTEGTRILNQAAPLVARRGVHKVWEVRDAIEELPERGEIRGRLAFALGLLLQQYNAPDEAERQYRLAAALLPRPAEAWNNVGVTYALRGRHAEALEAFARALRAEPGYREACGNATRASEIVKRRPPEIETCGRETP